MSHKARASSDGLKLAGGKVSESNVKPSEMLLDLSDDCEYISGVFSLKWFI